MNYNLSKSRTDTTLAGVFFIVATVSAIIGLKLYDPLLNNSNFLVLAKAKYHQIILGALSELILAIAATGTAIVFYPYLKRYRESIGLGYIIFRLLEVMFILLGIMYVLTTLSVCELYNNGNLLGKGNAYNLGSVFIAAHKWTFILGPNFMLAINTSIYSYVFYKTRIIPTPLSGLGLFASCLMMTAAILELFGIIQQISFWGILLALPIAIYEMILAIWLIFKGFRSDVYVRLSN